MRKKIIAANWKMHMTQSESEAFITTFLREIGELDEVEIVIVPPFTSIPKVSELLTQTQNIKLGAQNMHWERNGAFTGEISPAMLRELFVRYVVLGHSERRALFGETDEIVNRKVHAAHEALLRPIVCVGETLEQREKGEVEKILSAQLRSSLAGIDARELLETVIAYEPVWAIGTGKTASPGQAQEAHAFVRQTLREMSDEATAEKIRIQYGGSVKPVSTRVHSPKLSGRACLTTKGFAGTRPNRPLARNRETLLPGQ
jgi:triosephosphate isomerase (TIM)